MSTWITYSLHTARCHHQEVPHMLSWITYCLNTVRCHKIIIKGFCTCQAESLTYWTQPDATKSSPRGPAHVKLNHLLPTYSQMPSPRGSAYIKLNHLLSEHSQMQNYHQEVLDMSSWITYQLNTARCHKIITKGFCTCQAESLTA